MKKILSLILAGLMVLSCAAFVAADETETEATYEDYAISFLHSKGIYKGDLEGMAAEDMIKRYEMALFAARLSTGWLDDDQWEDDVANDSTFKDLDTEPVNSYLGAISYVNQNGIIEGYNADEFGPYDFITYRDCLTMIVRTLGYKGLTYPWGYIEKAVELGLTEKVDVPYTQELTRGQVATILYDALFVNTKSGETLAKSVFGFDYAWENIVIVASDKAVFEGAAKVAPAGFVAFKVLDDDNFSTMSSKTYFVAADELGLSGNADELAVGDVYLALFEVEDDIAHMAEAYYLGAEDYLWNFAGTGTKDVDTFMGNYQVVTYYNYGANDKDYITDKTYSKNPILLYAQDEIEVFGEDVSNVAVDVLTMNILVKNADGTYDIAWFYNPVVGNYWRVYTDLKDGKVIVDWMSDEEFDIWYAKAIQAKTGSNTGFEQKASYSSSIYSKLEVFDLNDDDIADRALLKSYRLGWVTFGTKDNKPTIAITGADTSIGVQAQTKDFWLNVREDVTTLNQSGKNLVVYNWNATSGELEIIKHVVKNDTDMNNNFIPGVLKGYSVKNDKAPYIVVDNTKYDVGYLAFQNDLTIYGKTEGKQAALAQEFDALLLQYVELTIVDGKVIDVEPIGADSNVIITLGYAGITADGYIAVYGYKTNSMDVEIFKIASYDGWKKGDFNYYPLTYVENFAAGTLLDITSYDANNNAYNVYIDKTLAAAGSKTATFKAGYRLGVDSAATKMTANDKYILIDDNGLVFVHTGVVHNEKWTVTGKYTNIGGIHVFYDCSGVVGFNAVSHNGGIVLYEEAADKGINLEAWYDDAILNGENAFLTEKDYLLGVTQTTAKVFDLLTGTYKYVVTANNIDLVNGQMYTTLGDTIIGNFGFAVDTDEHFGDAFYDVIADLYLDPTDPEYTFGHGQYDDYSIWFTDDYKDCKYIVANGVILKNATKLNELDVAKLLKLIDADALGSDLATIFAKELVTIKDAPYFEITKDGAVKALTAATLDATKIYYGFLVYNVEAKTFVVYVWPAQTEQIVTGEANNDGADVDEWFYNIDGKTEEASLTAAVAGTRDYTKVISSGAIVPGTAKAHVSGVTLTFDSILKGHEFHGDLAQLGYLFGIKDHDDESFFAATNTSVTTQKVAEDGTVGTLKEIPVTALTLGTYECAVDAAECLMVNSIGTALNETLLPGEKLYVNIFVNGGTYGNAIGVLLVVTADTNAVLDVSVAKYTVNGTDYATLAGATLKTVSLDAALKD